METVNKEKLSLVRRYPIEVIFVLAVSGLVFFTQLYITQGHDFRDYIINVSSKQDKVIEANTEAVKSLKISVEKNTETTLQNSKK